MLLFEGGFAAFSRATKLPMGIFGICGAAQVSAKSSFMAGLANGASFPVATLAKSGKMVPVMIGGIFVGGQKYSLQQYASVLAIIVGTCIVNMSGGGDKKGGGHGHGSSKPSDAANPYFGLALVVVSLICDGLVGGNQDKLKKECKKRGMKEPQGFEFMFYTNLFMFVVAFIVSCAFDLSAGMKFVEANPLVLTKLATYCLCSALGQSFIFFTISNFDALTCTTVTTTRKIFSVLLSIFKNGHKMSQEGWVGLALASGGILAEIADKMGGGHHDKKAHGDEKKEK